MRRVLGTAAALAAAVWLAQGVVADELSPQDACKRALTELKKQRSFAASVECQGGLADSPQKLKCGNQLVRRDYEAQVYKPVLKVQDPPSYVVYGQHKGASLDGHWKSINAATKGKEIPRLVRTPETMLAVALKYAKKGGRWLDEGVEIDSWSKPGETSKSDTVSRDAGPSAGERATPTRLRVVGPATVATKLIVEVQNSGCLSGGWGSPSILSRVEKKKSNVVYTITFDPDTGLPTEILESVVAISRPPANQSKQQYYIFSTHMRLRDYGQVERFDIPEEAVPLLK